MKRYELAELQERADRGSFYLNDDEEEALARHHPKVLFAWRAAEAAADYLQILTRRELESLPYEE